MLEGENRLEASVLEDDRQLGKNLDTKFSAPLHQLHHTDHRINANAFTQNDSLELQAAIAHKGRPEDWVILLEVDSVGDFQWDDAGQLFVVIQKSDLAKQDFSKIYLTSESS